MEHILQFAVSIDEQKIVDTATNRATEEILKKAKETLGNYTNRGWDTAESKLDRLFRDEIKKILDERKEEIIQDAIKQLAANLAKTKAVKEMVRELEEGN